MGLRTGGVSFSWWWCKQFHQSIDLYSTSSGDKPVRTQSKVLRTQKSCLAGNANYGANAATNQNPNTDNNDCTLANSDAVTDHAAKAKSEACADDCSSTKTAGIF